MAQPSDSNPILQYYEEWSSRTPCVTRSTMIGIVVIWLSSFFFPASLYLSNITYFTIMKFEIYRIFLSPLVGNSFITVIVIALFYPVMGGRMESSLGSAAYIYLLGILDIAINVAFNAVCLFLYYSGTHAALGWQCAGFWNVLFALIVIECMQMPDVSRRLMCIPIDIPSKYFPFALYGLFSLFGGLQLDLAVSMAIGFAHSHKLLDRFIPSPTFVERSEITGPLSYFINTPGWIRYSGALGSNAWSPQQLAADSQEAKQQQSRESGGSVYNRPGQPAQGPPKEQFPGSGHTLAPTNAASSLINNVWSSSAVSTTAVSREVLAARRLAALQQAPPPVAQPLMKPQASIELNATPTTTTTATTATDTGALHQLMEMGFSRNDASRALALSGGSLQAATQLLTT